MTDTRTTSADPRERYVSMFGAFESSLNGARDLPFHERRREAIARFGELGFPTRRDERWKYTDLKPLIKQDFEPATAATAVSSEAVDAVAVPELNDQRLVFVNGHYVAELSNYKPAVDGVVVGSLAAHLRTHGELIDAHLTRYADHSDNAMVALNTAYTQDGLFIYVPDDGAMEVTPQVIFLNDATQPVMSTQRNLILAGKNARVKLVEVHAATGGGEAYFSNSVVEVVAAESARIDHVKIQREDPKGYHHYHLQAHQESHSNYTIVSIDVGGRLVRNTYNLSLDAPECEGHLIGFYIGGKRQHIDNSSFINHAQPHCMSNELYKGILGGKAQGVFNGKIYVAEDAQKTNAYQNNKALLLSDDARINTKPELEIFADDVRCSHGATVGQLDPEALFYLMARGIDRDKAMGMLQHAFASDVFSYIPSEAVQAYVDHLVFDRFDDIVK